MNVSLPRQLSAALKQRLQSRRMLPVLVIAAAVLISTLLYLTRPEMELHAVEHVPTTVRFVIVEPQDMHLMVQSQGVVQPRTESDVVPEVSGTVVWKSPALVSGGRFSQGDVLLRIDERDYRNALGNAEAARVRTQAEAEFSRFEHERLSKLQARDLTSRSQAENAQRAMRVADSNLQDAEVDVQRARLDLARTEIHAPFAGRVRSVQADIGQMVSRGDAIATIYATDYVELRLPIADRQLAWLDPALMHSGVAAPEHSPTVRIDADFAGRSLSWDGRIVRTEGEIDARSRMVHVVARVENPDTGDATPLPVGLFVNARIRGQLARGVVEVPRAAMRDGNRVLVIDGENRLRFREVDVMRVDRDTVLLRAGLASGERVCVSPLQVVVEGMPVIPTQDMPAGQG